LRKTERLKKLVHDREILVAPGVHDCLTARIIEEQGFSALYMTGYGTSASMLGKADVGLLTLTEMAWRVSRIADAVDIPLIADGDTGYGNAVNVARTVREYEKAGAACIQLEDQVAPKKCGHMTGREIIPSDEMAGKIKAACDSRHDRDFMIMARTDARTTHGIDEAIERGHIYAEAGADILFIESPETEDEMKTITTSFDVPVLANMVEHGRTPFLPVSRLQETGYDIAIFPVTATFAMARAVSDVMKVLKESGSTLDYKDRMMDFETFNDLVGLSEIREMEKKYSTGR
jgi:carboxyvinyl-carboxyphosphonate phosphorylmutase